MPYSASQLVSLAGQICDVPGRVSQIGQFLNMILADYAQTMDEDVVRQTTTLNIGPQAVIPYANPLPSNYLRAYDVFYLVQGEPFYVTQMELDEFDKLFTGQGIDNYPERFATDMSQSPPAMYFYPPPAIPLAVTIRYRPQTSDITTPETSATIPWFPNQRALLKDLCVDTMMLSDNPQRGALLEKEVERRMNKYLIMSDDKEGYSQQVKLDPNTFRLRGNLPPSKKLGF
jgi:hypothetical protein